MVITRHAVVRVTVHLQEHNTGRSLLGGGCTRAPAPPRKSMNGINGRLASACDDQGTTALLANILTMQNMFVSHTRPPPLPLGPRTAVTAPSM